MRRVGGSAGSGRATLTNTMGASLTVNCRRSRERGSSGVGGIDDDGRSSSLSLFLSQPTLLLGEM